MEKDFNSFGEKMFYTAFEMTGNPYIIEKVVRYRNIRRERREEKTF